MATTPSARILPDMSAIMARLEALEAENARLRSGGKSASFEQSANNPKYWVFKDGRGKGYPMSGDVAMWRAVLANAKLIEAALPND